MNRTVKKALFWMVIIVAAYLSWRIVVITTQGPLPAEISYSEFLSQVEAGNVVKVTIARSQINGRFKDDSAFRLTVPVSQEGMLQTLHQKNVEIWIRDTDGGVFTLLCNLLPFLLLAGLWFFMIRQIRTMKQSQVQVNQVGNPPASIG
jgi:cell division protease FtsH